MIEAEHIPPGVKASILAEALPYIRRFSGSTIVIKYGGNAMTEPHLKEAFAKDVVLLKLVGINPVIVHGGGPQINDMLNKVGKEGTFVQGMRVTDGETMDIVEMVLGGHVNKDIVSLLNQNGGKAVGITGRDSHFIKAKKLFINTPERNGVDIGQVGVVESIDCSLIKGMVERGYIGRGVPLLKRVLGLPGQRVCRSGATITVDNVEMGAALERDRMGRDLPVWQGCRIIRDGELFLMNWDIRDSLDGRYFGPVLASSVIGRALPLWTDEEGDGRYEWRAATH